MWKAARTCVRRIALEAGAMQRLNRLSLGHSVRARVLQAQSLLLAACGSVGVQTCSICAENGASVELVKGVFGALLLKASALRIAALLLVVIVARGIEALTKMSIELLHCSRVTNPFVAARSDIAASITVCIVNAHKALALYCVSIPLVHILIGT